MKEGCSWNDLNEVGVFDEVILELRFILRLLIAFCRSLNSIIF